MAQAVLGTQRDEGDIGSLTGRVDVWQACLAAAADHWLFGFGYSGFWTPERILQISAEVQWGMNQAHSTYIDVLLSTGAVGLTLYVVPRFWWVLSSQPGASGCFGRRRRFMAAAVLVFSIVHGMTESVGVSPVLTAARC